MIQVSHLSKRYGDLTAVDDLSPSRSGTGMFTGCWDPTAPENPPP